MTEEKKENFELRRIIRNTKKMEEDFIKNNIDLNKNNIQGCKNIDGDDIVLQADTSFDISPKVTDKHIRNFIDKLRNAYHNSEVVYVDNKRMLLTPIEFRTAMEKLKIYDDIDYMVEDFQYIETKEKETA